MNENEKQHRTILQSIAQRAMLERGLLPDFSAEALAELGKIQAHAATNAEPVRDLRDLLWASIDNDDSRDLDQLSVAEAIPGDKVKILVAIADILKEEGYVDNYRVIKDNKQGVLRVYLKYINKRSAIINLKRVSRPGLRIYADVKHTPRVLRGKGTTILTTSKGLMTGVKAKEANVGGEVLCYIW